MVVSFYNFLCNVVGNTDSIVVGSICMGFRLGVNKLPNVHDRLAVRACHGSNFLKNSLLYRILGPFHIIRGL